MPMVAASNFRKLSASLSVPTAKAEIATIATIAINADDSGPRDRRPPQTRNGFHGVAILRSGANSFEARFQHLQHPSHNVADPTSIVIAGD